MIISSRMTNLFLALLGIVLLTLTFISLAIGSIVVAKDIDSGLFYKVFQLFNLDFERNVPTWFSSFLLLVDGMLLVLIAYYSKIQGKPYFLHWLGLGLIFFVLSMDEFVRFHEETIEPLREVLNTDGFLYNAWIIPAAIALVPIGLFYLPMVLNLPDNIRKTFLIAGSVYVGAVIGIEAIGGYYFSSVTSLNETETFDFIYLFITHLEELLEMAAVILFMRGLFNYLHSLNPLPKEKPYTETEFVLEQAMRG
jgi:hypothetical protein